MTKFRAEKTLETIQRLGHGWLKAYPKRVTRQQKRQFLAAIESELQQLQFPTQRVTARKVLRNELLLTECRQPRFIFTAHYDTPTIMPFWFSWLFRLFGHTRQIMMLIFLLGVMFILPAVTIRPTPTTTLFAFIFQLLLLLSFMTLFIPNPTNAEDNSSGVVGLLALAEWVGQQEGLREQVQFVFLDNEELGLLGSGALKRLWDKQAHPYQNAAIINLDCVSRGEIPLVAYHYNAALADKVLPTLKQFLPSTTPIDMSYLPLSDNYTFRETGAIDISFANRSILPGGFYIPKIHVPSDKDFHPEKMLPLIEGLAAYVGGETAVST